MAESSDIPFQWQLKVFHFLPSVGFAFVLNLAEGTSSIHLLSIPFPT